MKKLLLPAIMLLASVGAVAVSRIAVLSDIHVEPGNACDSALRVAVNTINNIKDLDLVVLNGDLSNEGSDVQLTNVSDILKELKPKLFVLPGNHENTWSQSATATFPDMFGDDRIVTALSADSLLIVGINCGPFMKMGDGHIKQEDLHWLDETLSSRLKPGMRVLSFNHYPLNRDLDNIEAYEAVLARYPVLFHVNGHYHTWQHYRSLSGMLDCVSVRALQMKRDDIPFGFTLLEIDGDNVSVTNRSADGRAIRQEYNFTARREVPDSFPATEIATVDSPAGWHIERVWADSASVFTRLETDPERVFFSTSTGIIKAVNKRTGQLEWSVPTDNRALFAKATLADGRLFVPTVKRGILILDPVTGNQLGSIDTDGRPTVADGLTFKNALYQGGLQTMRRINPVTGEVSWRLDGIGNYCQGQPVSDGRDVVFGAWDSYLYCVDARSGRLKWRWNNGREVNMLGPGNVVPVLTDKYVITVAPDRYMTAIDRKSGATVWRDNSVRYRESLGMSPDRKTVYAKTMDGELVAVDITGKEYKRRWLVDMGIGYDHAPCVVVVHPGTGLVIAGSRRGIITAVDPESQSVAWQCKLGSSEVNGIDIDPTTGDIYLSLIEGSVWRLAADR